MPNEQTTAYMAALGCHRIECSYCFLLVIIEVFALSLIRALTAQVALYKVSIALVSRNLWWLVVHESLDHVRFHAFASRQPSEWNRKNLEDRTHLVGDRITPNIGCLPKYRLKNDSARRAKQ